MHTDRKIGFAMGILLVGIVGALFFRNEPLTDGDVPSVRREKELNERLRERDVAVYLSDKQETTPDDEPPWTLRDVLKTMSERNKAAPEPVGKTPTEADQSAVRQLSTVDPRTGRDSAPLEETSPKIASDRTKHQSEGAESDSATSQLPPLPPERNADTSNPPSSAVTSAPDESSFHPPEQFEEYTIRFGDTLSGIAQKMLGSQTRYQEIFEANRDRMTSPDRLDVGKSIRIPRVTQAAPELR